MPRGRKLAPLTLTDDQQDQLQGIANSATLPYALVLRARIILASAEGLTNAAVAQRVGVTGAFPISRSRAHTHRRHGHPL